MYFRPVFFNLEKKTLGQPKEKHKFIFIGVYTVGYYYHGYSVDSKSSRWYYIKTVADDEVNNFKSFFEKVIDVEWLR